jgi:hypothetical protein
VLMLTVFMSMIMYTMYKSNKGVRHIASEASAAT